MIHRVLKRQTVRLTLLPVLALLAVFPALALGQSDAVPSEATEANAEDANAMAKKLMGEGNLLYAKRDFEGAHQKFLEAWAVKQHIAIASNLVETEMKLGRYAEAATRLRSLLSSMPMDDKDDRTAFMMQLAECRHHLVSLHITVDQVGATVKVDGKPVGKSPLDSEVLVEPGQSRITAELAGFQPATELTDKGAAGESKSISLSLVKPSSPKPAAAAPLAPAQASGAPESRQSGVSAKTIVLVSGTALAVVGVGLGVVYWRLRTGTYSDATELRDSVGSSGCVAGQEVSVTRCAQLHEAWSRYDDQSRIMAGMFIGGGIAAAATVVTYLLWPSGESKSADAAPVKAALLPWSSPNSAGLNVVGQF